MSALADVSQWLYDTSISTYIRESLYLFPVLNTVHVVAIVLLAGTIAVVDLRLLGLTLRGVSITRISAQVLPITWIGAVILFLSGGLLFAAQASRIQTNIALRIKLLLLIAAGINVLAWHLSLSRNASSWDRLASPPWQAKLAGSLSLLLWSGIIVTGRLIAFVA